MTSGKIALSSLRTIFASRVMPKTSTSKQGSTSKEGAAGSGSNWLPITVTKSGELSIPLQVKPGSKVTCITDVSRECVRLQISAPPVDGEANLAIIKFFSAVLGVKKSDLELKGGKSKQKTVFVSNTSDLTGQSIHDILQKQIGIQY